MRFIETVLIILAGSVVNFSKHEDTHCTDGDLELLDEVLLETCEDACLQNPTCVGFIHYPVVPYVCWLKHTCDEHTLAHLTGYDTYIRIGKRTNE